MSAVMNPEIQKLQKKYAGKRDQASQMKMQEEMNLIYEKYGTSADRRMSSDADSVSDAFRIVSGNSEYSEICNRCKKCLHADRQ